ncbi:MAG: hypothetical protein A2901_04070 [Elusimicrobia bacterium RIFCSPLOWO2_01_FULL_54_10]|nr:MAG: hypothetical protein A2901_04070 [Elusimicrobia bacterium RIFCSPLOWO2_01_FULL_54_10]
MKSWAKISGILMLGLLCGAMPDKTVYDFSVKSIDGKEISLKDYSGKVLLIVNTASECGFTGQYKDLEAVYQKYKDKRLVVLGFPSNDYGGQEPGSNSDIKSFCEMKFKTTFPLFDKGPVSGDGIQPLFKHLTETANPKHDGKILWNFEKFVVDREGRLIERYRSITSPSSGRVAKVLEKALAEPAGR